MVRSEIPVGTQDYIAPEVLVTMNSPKGGHPMYGVSN